MDRRGFFKLFGAGVAGIALEQAIPLGRVWSFPSKIVVPWYGVDFGYGEDETTIQMVEVIDAYIKVPQGYLVKRIIDKHLYEVIFWPEALPFQFIDSYSGGPPTRPPVAQLKSLRDPDLAPARGIPQS